MPMDFIAMDEQRTSHVRYQDEERIAEGFRKSEEAIQATAHEEPGLIDDFDLEVLKGSSANSMEHGSRELGSNIDNDIDLSGDPIPESPEEAEQATSSRQRGDSRDPSKSLEQEALEDSSRISASSSEALSEDSRGNLRSPLEDRLVEASEASRGDPNQLALALASVPGEAEHGRFDKVVFSGDPEIVIELMAILEQKNMAVRTASGYQATSSHQDQMEVLKDLLKARGADEKVVEALDLSLERTKVKGFRGMLNSFREPHRLRVVVVGDSASQEKGMQDIAAVLGKLSERGLLEAPELLRGRDGSLSLPNEGNLKATGKEALGHLLGTSKVEASKTMPSLRGKKGEATESEVVAPSPQEVRLNRIVSEALEVTSSLFTKSAVSAEQETKGIPVAELMLDDFTQQAKTKGGFSSLTAPQKQDLVSLVASVALQAERKTLLDPEKFSPEQIKSAELAAQRAAPAINALLKEVREQNPEGMSKTSSSVMDRLGSSVAIPKSLEPDMKSLLEGKGTLKGSLLGDAAYLADLPVSESSGAVKELLRDVEVNRGSLSSTGIEKINERTLEGLKALDAITRRAESGAYGESLKVEAMAVRDQIESWKKEAGIGRAERSQQEELNSLQKSQQEALKHRNTSIEEGAQERLKQAIEGSRTLTAQATQEAQIKGADFARESRVAPAQTDQDVASINRQAFQQISSIMANPAQTLTTQGKMWNSSGLRATARAFSRMNPQQGFRGLNPSQRVAVASYAAWFASRAEKGALPGFSGAEVAQLRSQAQKLIEAMPLGPRQSAGVQESLRRLEGVGGAMDARERAQEASIRSVSASQAVAAIVDRVGTRSETVSNFSKDIIHATFSKNEVSRSDALNILRNADRLTPKAMEGVSLQDQAKVAAGLESLLDKAKRGEFGKVTGDLRQHIAAADSRTGKLIDSIQSEGREGNQLLSEALKEISSRSSQANSKSNVSSSQKELPGMESTALASKDRAPER